MNLKEALQLYQGHQIKVGAEMSFFYCEICDENIFDIIENLSNERFAFIHVKKDEFIYLYDNFEKEWKNKFKRRLNAFEQRRRNKIVDENKKVPVGKLAKIINRELNSKEYKQELQEYIEKMEKQRADEWKFVVRSKERYTNYCETWIPFLEREVVEIYDAELYECKIIRIVGPELGKYWDRGEYNARCN